ncbi:hypothetical protein D3C80_2095390 [compost metagenome]
MELGKPLPTGTKDLRQDAPGTSPGVRIKQLEEELKASREENAATQAAVVALFEMIMPSAPESIPEPDGPEGTAEEVM